MRDLSLSRDPASGKVILEGWPDATPPQMLMRERQQGRFLTPHGWQACMDFVPLMPGTEADTWALEVDGGALPPGTRVQLEIPASGHSQDAVWPPDLQAIAEALVPPVRSDAACTPPRPAPGRPAQPARPIPAYRRAAAIGAIALPLVTLLAGFALGWLAAPYLPGWADAGLTARLTENNALRADLTTRLQETTAACTAEAEQQAGVLAQTRADLARARTQSDTDRQALLQAQGELEAAKTRLAAAQAAAATCRPGQTPAAVSPDGPDGLPVLQPDLPGAAPDSVPFASVQQAAQQCDLLAANPLDRNRTPGIAGVAMPQLRANASIAIAVCRNASASLPWQLQYTYQLARALQPTDPNQAEPLLRMLVRQRYPAAFDNLAWILLNRNEDPARAEGLLRDGVALGDPGAMFTLALLLKKNQILPHPGENYRDLLLRSANLGHDGALALLNSEPKAFTLPFHLPWMR